jgi:hypothetical protein
MTKDIIINVKPQLEKCNRKEYCIYRTPYGNCAYRFGMSKCPKRVKE